MAKQWFGVLVLAACLGSPVARGAPAPEVTRLAQSQAPGPIALGTGVTRIPLAALPVAAALAQAVGKAAEVYLVFTGLQADPPPGVVFDIYLAPPPGFAPGPDSPFLAGALNFFAARAHPTVSLDVTAVAHTLASQGRLGARFDVVVASTTAPAAGSHPVVSSVTLVAQ